MQPVNSSIRRLWSLIITTKKRFDVNSLSSGLKRDEERGYNERVCMLAFCCKRKRAPKNTNICIEYFPISTTSSVNFDMMH